MVKCQWTKSDFSAERQPYEVADAVEISKGSYFKLIEKLLEIAINSFFMPDIAQDIIETPFSNSNEKKP